MPEPQTLDGCAPTPLASYLKALGLLRLISSDANHVSGQAADPNARGWWENERFHLRTQLDRDALCRFFLDEYAPSPVIAPWNGRAGFLEGEAGEASNRTGAELMDAIEVSEALRLANMRRTVGSLREHGELCKYDRLRARTKALQQELKKLSGKEKEERDQERKRVESQSKQSKSLLLPNLRSTTDTDHLSYVDACYVLSADEIAAPILGSGGNDGSRDFGVNFAERLRDLFDFDDGMPTDRGRGEIVAALFDVGWRLHGRGSMGQYSPGLGGPNSTTGYEGYSPLNSWDLVLAMEGTVLFAGALTRRWGAGSDSRAAFPFTFEPTNAGSGVLSTEDSNRPRGEIWIPLWSKPATFSEISAILAEGRLTLGRRVVRNGLDAARSVARIGLSRGIGSFERYSIYQSDSKMPYQATPLGRIFAPSVPRRDLAEDLETGGWLTTARKLLTNKKKAPSRARVAMRRLEDALFQMTNASQTSEGACNALMALGGLVNWMATNPQVRRDLRPPPAMSRNWIWTADDGSSEFRVAAALAGLGLPPIEQLDDTDDTKTEMFGNNDAADGEAEFRQLPAQSRTASPMAAHFAPIHDDRFFNGQRLRTWTSDETSPSVVWGTGTLVSNMIAVLERRLVEAAMPAKGRNGSGRALEDKPLAGAVLAGLADVGSFLSGDFDDRRCAALLAGMIWVRPALLSSTKKSSNADASPAPIPFAYAAIKPIFTPDRTLHRIRALVETAKMPIPPGLVARLRAGGRSRDGRATDAAVRTALDRARASGLPSPFESGRVGGRRPGAEGGRIGAGLRADRLAAALLVPIDDHALKVLVERAFPKALPEETVESAEDTNDAA